MNVPIPSHNNLTIRTLSRSSLNILRHRLRTLFVTTGEETLHVGRVVDSLEGDTLAGEGRLDGCFEGRA